ncbi:TPA: dinitrogenase iron-molybdenum cofactor biosynthesis protein [Methanosarcina acetivorans]|uniref:Dinitrogenase iron-molybdenum cofactor biosynthesis domain-containing protein n=2 Tax=Methanosarcina acetivorans TaxID=2214 RepID=Q8TLU1_METAC|nr:NifB/NifX family molybdenum-iron cluster-binding protein [Methanosarcina acetivorans]AAM06310.1 conserved hypothetical protein [Methanosarcina acetivorans C2A]HIH93961.1 dinitrogenase iron-molybdenum cofactor biosynthesis protein [Methanosarcina acetivorans]
MEIKAMKVAVISTDGKVINQHFGKASRFYIFEIGEGKIQFLEVRECTPLCGSADYGNPEEVLNKTISVILDCEALLCARIGSKPQEELRKKGIEPIEAPYLIDEALNNILTGE